MLLLLSLVTLDGRESVLLPLVTSLFIEESSVSSPLGSRVTSPHPPSLLIEENYLFLLSGRESLLLLLLPLLILLLLLLLLLPFSSFLYSERRSDSLLLYGRESLLHLLPSTSVISISSWRRSSSLLLHGRE